VQQGGCWIFLECLHGVSEQGRHIPACTSNGLFSRSSVSVLESLIDFLKSTATSIRMKKATNIISWVGLLPLLGHVAILFYYVT
jgi:hypothetical protein